MIIYPSKSYRRIIAIFIILAISMIGVVIYFTLSKAKITLAPKTETKMVDFTVVIDKNATAANLEQGILQGELIAKEVSRKEKAANVSVKQIPDFAKGKVTIYNKQNKEQALLPKSHLLSESGIYFLTDERAVVPKNSSAEVGVTAEKEGEEGNIAPGRFVFDRLSPSLKDIVYAESAQPMTGGAREVKSVTEDDIKNAFLELEKKLEEEVKNEIKEGLQDGEELVPDNLVKEVLEENKSVEPNTEASEFEVEAKIKLSGFVINKKSLLETAEFKLSQNIPDNREFVKMEEESVKTEIKNIYLADGKIEIRVHAEGELAYKVSPKAFDKSKLIGLNKEETKKYFSDMGGIQDISVEFSPLWVKTVPSIKNNINIQVKY